MGPDLSPDGSTCARCGHPDEGLVALAHHLLEVSPLSPEACALARQHVAVPGLQHLPCMALHEGQPEPIAFYRWLPSCGAGSDGSLKDAPVRVAHVEVVLLDLRGDAGAAALWFTPASLPCAAEGPDLYIVRQVAASVSSPTVGAPPRTAACATHDDHGRATHVFSRDELLNGQMHARAPARGLICFSLQVASSNHPCPPATVVEAGAPPLLPWARAHLLSSLHRLARRPSEYALHNHAARTLQALFAFAHGGSVHGIEGASEVSEHGVKGAPDESGPALLSKGPSAVGADTAQLLSVVSSSLALTDEAIASLSLTLSAAVHMTVAAGLVCPAAAGLVRQPTLDGAIPLRRRAALRAGCHERGELHERRHLRRAECCELGRRRQRRRDRRRR